MRDGTSALLSKHGPTLDRILIVRRKFDETFSTTLLRVSPDMLPHELGEVILSRSIATPGISDVYLRELSVEYIGEKKAVRLVYDYQINDIIFTDVVFGFLDVLYLYEVRLTGTKRHYLNESLNDFTHVVQSFRLR